MKFKLEVRMVEDRDLSPTTPFLPDEDQYEMHLQALLQDLSQVKVISNVKRSASTFQIETARSLPLEEFRIHIKPALTGSNSFRFVSLVTT